MKCLYCQKELIGKRAGAKFCDDKCKLKFSRHKKVVMPQVITVSPNRITDTDNDTLNDTDNLGEYLDEKYPDIEITPEVLGKLEKIHRAFEKENTGFKSIPYTVKGVRVLTIWEKMKLQELDKEVKI